MSLSEFTYSVLLGAPFLRRVANSILLSILPRTIRINGATIHLNPEDPVISGALALRVYERPEIAFFCKWLEPSMAFVDIGANVGLYTGIALSRKNFHGKVLCIEPDPQSRKYLERTIQSNGAAERRNKVTVCSLAASDAAGQITLFKNSQNKGDNRIYPDPLCDEQETIQAKTLDSICRESSIAEINFLKVDVQGAEGRVFRGASSILSNSPDCIILTEFWPYGLLRCGTSPSDCLLHLQSVGFTLYELENEGLCPITDIDEIITRSPGRAYRNLIALKGIYEKKHNSAASGKMQR